VPLSDEAFYLEDKKIYVYKRNGCGGIFHCRIRFKEKKGYVRKSLWTSDKEEAKREAEKLYRDLKYNIERGISISGKKFSKICEEYLTYLAEQVVIGKSKEKKLKDYTLIANRYLIAYFGKREIKSIIGKDIELFRDWREKYWITGPGKDIEFIEYERDGKIIKTKARHITPSSSTVNTEETVLRKVFEFAVTKGDLSQAETPTIKTERVTSNRRPGFSIEEYRKLWRESLKRVKAAPQERIKRQRLLLHDFILIMANSGLRPVEAKSLQWKDVRNYIAPDTKNEHVILSVRGKSKKRDMVAQPKVKTYLDRLRER